MHKIDPHLGLFREEAVLAHFRTLVAHERVAGLSRQCPQCPRFMHSYLEYQEGPAQSKSEAI